MVYSHIYLHKRNHHQSKFGKSSRSDTIFWKQNILSQILFLENNVTEKITKNYFLGEGVATFMPIDYNFKGSLK
jgi:hypothetical protein